MSASVVRLGLLAAALATLPRWLPARVVALRMWIFARVDGDEGLPIPGPTVGTADFLRVYADPAAGGRSRGARLSDLFWYWLSPGAHVHQEHLEAGPRYDEVARTTRRILARSRPETEELARRVATRVLDGSPAGERRLVRLRDEMMPIWAEFYYELVFGEPCPRHARDLIVGGADDVASALKCVRPRNMRRRHRLTRYLRQRLPDVPHPLPSLLTGQERAWYLQGTFFTTAVVQMSDAMAHLLLLLARHPDVQDRLAGHPDDDAYLDGVINESLRLYPLFGVAHRISTAEIDLDRTTIPAGTVLTFSYPAYHQPGPDRFDPDRWRHGAPEDTPFLPFGVTANRVCPARGLAPITMRVVTREVLRRSHLASSAAHTRSLPNRGPCLVVPRGAPVPTPTELGRLAVRDRWEDVWRSVAQLVFGTFMVLHARRLRLAATYFESLPESGPVPTGTGCPIRSTA